MLRLKKGGVKWLTVVDGAIDRVAVGLSVDGVEVATCAVGIRSSVGVCE